MNKVCTDCGYVGKPTAQGLGSFTIDGFIWLFSTGFFLVTMLLPVMLIPVIWTTYHVFTYYTVACKECGNYTMVSIDSEAGAKAMYKFKIAPGTQRANESAAADAMAKEAA